MSTTQTPPRSNRSHASSSQNRTSAASQPPRLVENGRVLSAARTAKTRGKGKGAVRHRFTASTADKYDLYQRAVQSPEMDVAFHRRVYETLRGRTPLHFREDFCGTGLLSATWIQKSARHTAEGFDLDPVPVEWGRVHNFEPLGSAASRYTAHLEDVRTKGRRPADVRVAQNFSYCVFKTRAELLGYFRAARAGLARDGVFIIDLHGGSEATEVLEESQRCGGFTYVWDQASFWPGTGETVNYIHFRFPDGTQLHRAFRYHWRMWYLTELRDLLFEAGFGRVERYFEGTDADGVSGNGRFRRGVRGEDCASWIAYLVALPEGG
jgi:hypothetical protein